MADIIPDFLGTPAKTGAGLLVVGAVGTYFASSLPDARSRNLGVALGSAVIGLGVFKLAVSVPDLAAAYKGAIDENLENAAALPPGTGTFREQVAGAIGRITGHEPPPGVTTLPDRPAVSGPTLGAPKNALRVAGKIRSPQDGGSVVVRLAENSYAVDAAIENQDKVERYGLLQPRLTLAGKTTVFPGTEIKLAPGEFRQVVLRVPFVQVGFTPFREHELALLFRNYKLDSVKYKIDRRFF